MGKRMRGAPEKDESDIAVRDMPGCSTPKRRRKSRGGLEPAWNIQDTLMGHE